MIPFAINRQACHAASRALNRACYQGDADAALDCLGEGADPAYQGASGKCAMHFAAMGGHAHLIAALARSAPSSATLRDHAGMTPLHLACRNGRLDAALALIRAGASLRSADDFGRSAFESCEDQALRAALADAERDTVASAPLLDAISKALGASLMGSCL